MSAQQAAAAGMTSIAPMLWSQLSTTPVIPLGGGSNATVSFAVRGPDPTETLWISTDTRSNNGNTGDFDVSLLDPAALQEVQLGLRDRTLIPDRSQHDRRRRQHPDAGTHEHGSQLDADIRRFVRHLRRDAPDHRSDNRFGYALSLHGATSSGPSIRRFSLRQMRALLQAITKPRKASEAIRSVSRCYPNCAISWVARTDTATFRSTFAIKPSTKTSPHC